ADGMILTDAAGVVAMANAAYCRMVDKPPAAVEGHSMGVILREECRAAHAGKLPGLFPAVGGRAPEEKEVVLWNGKRIWFEIVSSTLERDGEAPLILSIFRDVSQRKQAEKELETIHKQLIDASRLGGMAEVAT